MTARVPLDEVTVTDRVLQAVATTHPTDFVTTGDILSRQKHRPIVQSRMVAVYLVRELGHYSYPRIARMLGLDHTTCIRSWRMVKADVDRGGPLRTYVLSALRQMQP